MGVQAERRVSLLRLGFAAVAIAACLASGGTVSAAPVDVIVDSDAVALSSGDEGGTSAKVVLVNTRESAVLVEPTVANDAGCSVTANPAAIPGGRRTSVALALNSGCEVDTGAQITLAFGPDVTPQSVVLEATPPDDAGADWSILKEGAIIAAVLLLAPLLSVLVKIHELNQKGAEPEAAATRLAARREEYERRLEARKAGGVTATALGDEPGPHEDKPPRIGWRTVLGSLGTDWSFKEAWASNVTLGATALIALFATSDVLTAVLGDEPKAALGLLAVASGISAAFVAIGSLLLKAIGDDAGTPTVGGTVVAGLAVLAGSLLQTSAITLQAMKLTDLPWLQIAIVFFGIGTVVAMLLYGARSLGHLIEKGVKDAPPPVPPEIRAAWIIARAIRPGMKATELSPLDIEETLKMDPGVGARLLAEFTFAEEAAAPQPPRRRTALL